MYYTNNDFQRVLVSFLIAYIIEIDLFTLMTLEGFIHNYYKSFKQSLTLKAATWCIKDLGVKTFEKDDDVYIKYLIISFITAFQKLQKWFKWFPRRQNKYYLPLSFSSKSIHPPLV